MLQRYNKTEEWYFSFLFSASTYRQLSFMFTGKYKQSNTVSQKAPVSQPTDSFIIAQKLASKTSSSYPANDVFLFRHTIVQVMQLRSDPNHHYCTWVYGIFRQFHQKVGGILPYLLHGAETFHRR